MKKKPSNYLKLFTKFLENIRIDSKHETAQDDERGIKLDLWESQQRVLNAIGNGLDQGCHVFYILKSRQLGVSTITVAILIFWAAIHKRINCALVIDNEENSQKFRAMVVKYVESFPEGYFGDIFKIVKNNAKVVEFSNGSAIDFLVAGKSKTTWGESRAYTAALLSEVSKYGRAEGLNSFMETLSETNPIRIYLFESTAHGPNHWKRMWEDAGTDIHVKRRVFVGWWSSRENKIDSKDPRFKIFGAAAPSPLEKEQIEAVKALYDFDVSRNQLAWYRWRQSNKAATKEMLDEQQPWTESEAFVLSGMSFFQVRKVTEDLGRARENAFLAYRYYLGNSFMASKREQITDPNRRGEIELRVWEPPVADGRYAIGMDPAYGRNDNADNTAICVARCFADRWVQVAEFATNSHEPREAAWVMAHLAGEYKNCIVNLEIGGPGDAIMMELNSVRQQLRAEEYQKAMGVDGGSSTFLDTMRWYLYHRPDSMGSGYVYNWQTTFRTKWRLIGGFRDSHVTEQAIINSVPCLNEMYDVTQEGSEIGALGAGLHDDRVFAAALADECWKSWIRPSMMQNGLTYDRVMQPGGPVQARISDLLNTRVMQTLNRPMETEPVDKFLADRGLA